MIIRDDEIRGRFKDLLKDHTQVDLATAWATGGEHLRILEKATKQEHRRVKVRAIVGTAGNATRPDALEELDRITNGDLRIISGGDRLFHPKLYLFSRHMNGSVESHAWVGSANFTNAGFGGLNEEIIVEIGPGRRPMRSPPGSENGGIAASRIPPSGTRSVSTKKIGSGTRLIETSERSFPGPSCADPTFSTTPIAL